MLRDVLLRHLPERAGDLPPGPDAALVPDVLALRDDLAHAAALLEAGLGDAGAGLAGAWTSAPGEARRAYLAGFVRGVARHARDAALAEASGLEEIRALLQDRLKRPDRAFDRIG